ncbi:MAG: hypothetical protein HY239_21445, partial [Mycolicibacterium aromaticivorans]|nr:hypothetical protein [Mycolicibacterium aromaticivorans]
MTSIIEPVRDTPPSLRDPVDVVKAALDGTPPPKLPPPPPPRRPGGSGGPGGPPPFKPPTFSQQVNWKWVRRSLYL